MDETMTAPKHPAKFSEPILDVLTTVLRREQRAWGKRIVVFDPFAGVGRIHRLYEQDKIETVGMEIEPEWACCHERTMIGDSIVYMEHRRRPSARVLFELNRYHVLATSPTYGNRLADHHNAQDGSARRSYAHDLGRLPSPESSATLPWGPKYWAFMARAYRAMRNVVRPGGLVAINVSDFYRHKQLVHAVEWHAGALWGAGFETVERPMVVETSRLNGIGAEATSARADYEVILLFRQPGVPS